MVDNNNSDYQQDIDGSEYGENADHHDGDEEKHLITFQGSPKRLLKEPFFFKHLPKLLAIRKIHKIVFQKLLAICKNH